MGDSIYRKSIRNDIAYWKRFDITQILPQNLITNLNALLVKHRYCKMYGVFFTGILLNDSANYRVQRISTHRTLKDFGFGRHGIEETLQFESDYLIQHLRANTDKSHDLMSIFNFTVLNTLWKIVGDKRWVDNTIQWIIITSKGNSLQRVRPNKKLLNGGSSVY